MKNMEWNLPNEIESNVDASQPLSPCNFYHWDAATSTSFDQFASYNFVPTPSKDSGFDSSELMDTSYNFTSTSSEKGLSHLVNGSGSESPDSRSLEEYLEVIPDCGGVLGLDQINDILMNSLSDEDMRTMLNAVEPSQQDVNSCNKALPFQDILANLLNDPPKNAFYQNGTATANGLDASGTSLLSEDLLRNSSMTSLGSMASDASTLMNPRGSITESRMLFADMANPKIFEATVLHELEAVLSSINERTRICFRDAFYRLANDSKGVRDERERELLEFHHEPSFNTSSREYKMEEVEKETNVIDRAVANLLFDPSCAGPPDTWAPHGFPANTLQHMEYATI